MFKCNFGRVVEAMKVAWVVTGAGHFLKECLEIVEKNKDKINLFLSSAGIEVIKMYKYGDFLERRDINIVKDYKSSSPSCGAFAAGRYDLLVIAPATSNTVAKCALGIADSLPSNLFSQAGKSKVPILVLPSDVSPRIESLTPTGRRIMVYPRPVDLQHLRTLKTFPGVRVANDLRELEDCLKFYL